MKKTSKIIISALLLVVLLVGIGYAAIQNITLNITGTAKADPSQSNFKVMFSGEPTIKVKPTDAQVTAAITDDINATINVGGLIQKGDIVSVTYTVQNVSTDISTDLSVSTTNDNTEYFTLSSKLDKTSLVAGEATTLTVIVELTKLPIKESVNSTIGVQLVAMPVEPGKEGTSEGINDSSQTPEMRVANITNDNIGEYIDLGNNIVGTESTSDDWRILYNDGEKVYAILADYLPANLVPEAAGLKTEPSSLPYSVWSDISRETLLSGLTNIVEWNKLTNGISGAVVTGAPAEEMLENSYNIKNGFRQGNDVPTFDSTTKDYDLYVPHTEIHEDCCGYWMEPSVSSRYVAYNGNVLEIGCSYPYIGVRPVVELPLYIECSYQEGIWKVIN